MTHHLGNIKAKRVFVTLGLHCYRPFPTVYDKVRGVMRQRRKPWSLGVIECPGMTHSTGSERNGDVLKGHLGPALAPEPFFGPNKAPNFLKLQELSWRESSQRQSQRQRASLPREMAQASLNLQSVLAKDFFGRAPFPLHSPKPLLVFVDPPSWFDHMPVAADHHLRNPGLVLKLLGFGSPALFLGGWNQVLTPFEQCPVDPELCPPPTRGFVDDTGFWALRIWTLDTKCMVSYMNWITWHSNRQTYSEVESLSWFIDSRLALGFWLQCFYTFRGKMVRRLSTSPQHIPSNPSSFPSHAAPCPHRCIDASRPTSEPFVTSATHPRR